MERKTDLPARGGISICKSDGTVLLVEGWFLPAASVDEVLIHNEFGELLGRGALRSPRPDVLRGWPVGIEFNWTRNKENYAASGIGGVCAVRTCVNTPFLGPVKSGDFLC